jgi:hypothetical protein
VTGEFGASSTKGDSTDIVAADAAVSFNDATPAKYVLVSCAAVQFVVVYSGASVSVSESADCTDKRFELSRSVSATAEAWLSGTTETTPMPGVPLIVLSSPGTPGDGPCTAKARPTQMLLAP